MLNVSLEEVTDEDLPLGSLVLSMINGVALQWFISPDTVPTTADLAAAIRTLVQPQHD